MYNKKDYIKTGLVEHQVMIQLTRGKKSFIIAENQARLTIDDALHFGIQFPNSLNGETISQKLIGKYMKEILNHLIFSKTKLLIFKFKPSEIHAFNPDTGNDIVFAQNRGFKFQRHIPSNAFYYLNSYSYYNKINIFDQ